MACTALAAVAFALASFACRTRLARKPKCLIRTNPAGRTCRRNRRMNSTAFRVIVFDFPPQA